jgi:hypothetical protein
MRGSVIRLDTDTNDNEYHPATGLGALGWASGDHPSHNRLGSSGALESGDLKRPVFVNLSRSRIRVCIKLLTRAKNSLREVLARSRGQRWPVKLAIVVRRTRASRIARHECRRVASFGLNVFSDLALWSFQVSLFLPTFSSHKEKDGKLFNQLGPKYTPGPRVG